MSFLIDLFTGSSKWLYIALLVCAIGFVGASALSLSLYGDKAALNATVKKQTETITKQASDIKELQNTLVVKRAEIATQNARVKELEANIKIGQENAKKEIEAIASKYEVLRQSLNFKVDENATNANDVKSFINGFHWVRQ